MAGASTHVRVCACACVCGTCRSKSFEWQVRFDTGAAMKLAMQAAVQRGTALQEAIQPPMHPPTMQAVVQRGMGMQEVWCEHACVYVYIYIDMEACVM